MKPHNVIAPEERPSWDTLKAAFEAAQALEQQFDARHVDGIVTAAPGPERSAQIESVPRWVLDVSDRLTDARNAAEEALIFFPAPDLSAAIWKIEYARPRWQAMDDWPEEWWAAVLSDLGRLSDVSANEAAIVSVADDLVTQLEAANARAQAPLAGGGDAELEARNTALYNVIDRIQALPNTQENMPARAVAVCVGVDYTFVAADVTLSELSAHAEGNAGELIMQILACLLDQVAA